MKTRFPHQIEGAQFGARRGSAGFFMKPRTGKTLTVHDAAILLRCTTILIICPLSVAATWQAALLDEGYTMEQITVVHHDNRTIAQVRNLLLNTGKFFIVNYEKVRELDALHLRRKLLPALGLPDWDCVIVDESKRISNHEARITEYLIRYPKPEYQHRFCLSGTPAPESSREFASQFVFMDGHYFGYNTVDKYLAAYWTYDPLKYIWMVKDTGHFEEIRNYVQERSYCVSMEDLGLGCPIFTSRRFVATNNTQDLWLRWVRASNTYPRKGEEKPLLPIVRTIFERSIACGIHPLTKEIISENKIYDILDIYRDRPEPILVVSFFKPVIYRAHEIFTANGIPCEKIVDVSKDETERIRQKFQSGGVDIIFAQIGIIKEGLDFSRLKKIIHLSNSTSQNDTEQVRQRGQNVHRKDPYEVIEQISIDTTELKLSKALLTKEGRSQYFIVKELNKEILKRRA